MSFAWPMALWGLAVVALAAIAYLFVQRRRPRYVARFTNVDLLANIVARRPRWRRLPCRMSCSPGQFRGWSRIRASPWSSRIRRCAPAGRRHLQR